MQLRNIIEGIRFKQRDLESSITRELRVVTVIKIDLVQKSTNTILVIQ